MTSAFLSTRRVALIAAAATFVLHALANPHYGFARDELYFIICGMHPQFGYVDQPPVVPLLSAATQVFGHSLFLLRALPALFAALGVYVSCVLAEELGGGAYAQILTAIVVFFCSVLTSFGMKVSTDMVGLVTWPLMALLILQIARERSDTRLWMRMGIAAGITFESKYSVVFFAAALIAGLLLTPLRRILFTRGALLAAAIAIAFALPNVLWQWHYGFPMLELLRAGQNGKNEIAGPSLFLLQQLLITGFVLAAVWIAGLVWLLRSNAFRFLGYTYVLLIALMIVLHGKHYYAADIYPVAIAAGGVAIEQWIASAAARTVIAACAFAIGVLIAPLTLPVLPEQTYVAYQSALFRTVGLSPKATETEPGRDQGALPGDWADMHGWEAMAEAAKRAYDSLPAAQRARAVVLGGNYGEASAVAFFTPGVPVIGVHNQFWLWGTHGYDGSVLVQINGSCFHADGLYASRRLAARLHDRWAISYEKDAPVWICRGIRKPLPLVWTSYKNYE